MDLETFVSDTLVSILRGVRLAQADPEVGQYVAPHGIGLHEPAKNSLVSRHGMTTTTIVDFNVAATASTAAHSGGKAGVRVWAVEAGGERRAEHQDSRVSRIRFGTLLQLPRPPEG